VTQGLRVNEVYTSVQGEGPKTGVLTQFVRFAGCNMRCPGWPCDTQHAIIPALYMNDGVTRKWATGNLAGVVVANAEETGARNICLTGGEPFMQNHDELRDFIQDLAKASLSVEVFTNGSFKFPRWAFSLSHIMMDWKLAGSGEATTAVGIRLQNSVDLRPYDGIKFVVTSGEDLEEARQLTYGFMRRGLQAQFWVGAAWDKISDTEIVDYIQATKMPWRLNVQLHKHIWPADKRGV
jgi:7-carboxy-7-deazaguanine synthase